MSEKNSNCVRERLGVDAAIGFWKLSYCYKLQKIYALCENSICTGLPPVPLPCLFILTPVAPINSCTLLSAIALAGSWWVIFGSSELLFMTNWETLQVRKTPSWRNSKCEKIQVVETPSQRNTDIENKLQVQETLSSNVRRSSRFPVYHLIRVDRCPYPQLKGLTESLFGRVSVDRLSGQAWKYFRRSRPSLGRIGS